MPRATNLTKWRWHAAVLSMLSVASVAGCTSDRDSVGSAANQPVRQASAAPTHQSDALQSPTQEPTSSATPTQLPVPSTAMTGTAHIKDSDGYTFDVPYVFRPSTVEKQVAAEKPGYNSLVLKLHAELSVVNTTAGRDLTFKSLVGTTRPLGDAKIALLGLWPSDSPVCTYALGAAPTPGGSPCGVVLASMHLPDTLSAGQTTTTTTYAGIENAAPGFAHVPDAAVSSLQTLLAEPKTIVVAYVGSDSGRFANTCPDPDLAAYLKDQWVVNYVTYGMFNNGFMPISSTAGGCGANALVVQPSPN